MTLPGIITGQPISGQGFGQALFQLGPALPWESPLPFVPRALAQRLWPGGFVPGRFPAAQVIPPAPQVQPPIRPPVQPTPPANQVGNHPRPPVQPAPRKRVLERGTFPGWA